ncbi:hypothetical protein LT330_007426 [Penicillium expansum]|nr:hypothetical protein LT330_007426 [Penicillium expansum]
MADNKLKGNLSRVKAPSPLGKSIFVGLRLTDAVWHYAFLYRDWASQFCMPPVAAEPLLQLLVVMALGSGLKQAIHTAFISEQEPSSGQGFYIRFFNTVFNLTNILLSVWSLTSNRLPPTAELISRLSLLEREVQKLGAQKIAADVPVGSLEDQDIEESPESSSTVAPWPSKTPASVEAEAEEEGKEEGTGIHGGQIILEPDPDTSESTLGHQFGRLVINRSSGTSRYVNHRVLTDLGDQIKELRDAFQAPSSPTPSSEEEYPSSPGSTAAYSETHSPFIFGYRSSVSSLHEYRPSPTLSQLLLNVFEENIAPIIMIIHKPALRSLIQASWENPEELDRSSEALIFSVYFAAVSSMTPEECLIQLGEDHAIVVKRYRFAVEQALARAGFFHTHKLLVLQAAVLFLTCACNPEDTQFVWTMIAVVTRLRLGLGLHRDGTHFGLSPYETEMRRRVWWYIYLLDVQTCELEATSPQIREGDYDT